MKKLFLFKITSMLLAIANIEAYLDTNKAK